MSRTAKGCEATVKLGTVTRRDCIDQFSIVLVKHGCTAYCAVAVKLGAVTCRKVRVMFRQVERSIRIVLWCYGFVQQGEAVYSCGYGRRLQEEALFSYAATRRADLTDLPEFGNVDPAV